MHQEKKNVLVYLECWKEITLLVAP